MPSLLLYCCSLTWARVPLNSMPSTGDVCQGLDRRILKVTPPTGESQYRGWRGCGLGRP